MFRRIFWAICAEVFTYICRDCRERYTSLYIDEPCPCCGSQNTYTGTTTY